MSRCHKRNKSFSHNYEDNYQEQTKNFTEILCPILICNPLEKISDHICTYLCLHAAAVAKCLEVCTTIPWEMGSISGPRESIF